MRKWVVAIRVASQPEMPYKYVGIGGLTDHLDLATKHDTRAKARLSAAQVRILAGKAYRVAVLPTTTKG